MLLTALPPAPPTPNTVIFGFSSLISGIFRLIVMATLVVLTAFGRRASRRPHLLSDRTPPPRTSDAAGRRL